MSLESRITALAQAIAADIKSLMAGKQAALVSGSNIKTINGSSVLGAGDLEVSVFRNIDGGAPGAVFGGTTGIDGGTP